MTDIRNDNTETDARPTRIECHADLTGDLPVFRVTFHDRIVFEPGGHVIIECQPGDKVLFRIGVGKIGSGSQAYGVIADHGDLMRQFRSVVGIAKPDE